MMKIGELEFPAESIGILVDTLDPPPEYDWVGGVRVPNRLCLRWDNMNDVEVDSIINKSKIAYLERNAVKYYLSSVETKEKARNKNRVVILWDVYMMFIRG